MHSFPIELITACMLELNLFDLVSLAQTSRNASAAARNALFTLLLEYLPSSAVDRFCALLGASGGGIVGSAVLQFVYPSTTWQPYDLNIIVPDGGMKPLAGLLNDVGYNTTELLDSHIPLFHHVAREDGNPLFAYGTESRWVNNTVRLSGRGSSIVTVTEAKDVNIMRTVLSAETTLGTAVFTPTTIFFFHPRAWKNAQVVPRDGSIGNGDVEADRVATLETLHARGMRLVNGLWKCAVPCTSHPTN